MIKIILVVFFLSLFSISSFGLCISADTANLRKGPGTKYEVSWQVYKYMPLKKIKQKGKWIRVKDLDGEFHWVFKTLITTKYKCGVIKKKKANLRNKPGGKLLSTAEKYEAFKLIKISGKWAHVVDEVGDKFWVFRSLLWIN